MKRVVRPFRVERRKITGPKRRPFAALENTHEHVDVRQHIRIAPTTITDQIFLMLRGGPIRFPRVLFDL